MSGLLLDTCAVIWTALDEPISSAAKAALEEAVETEGRVCLSAITALEIGLLSSSGRQKFAMDPKDWFRTFLSRSGVELLGLEPDLLIGSCYLPECPIRDPFDRIVIATARMTGLTVITRDKAILAYARDGNVLALEC